MSSRYAAYAFFTMQIKNILHTVKRRLGDLWWYTLIIFVAQRLADVVHAVIGVWLVPRYVPQSELGAVLPLMSVGGLLGLPLAVFLMPFMKFLNKYMAQGEWGKVKRLLRDSFLFAGVVFVVVSLASRFLLPLVFDRMRVENGSLSMLIVISGVIAAFSPIFTTALQALKKFTVLSAVSMLTALVRLATMMICLPIRGISGYFVGQIVPHLFNIGVAFVALRKQLGRKIKMVSYWNEDWKSILYCLKWIALLSFASALQSTIQTFVIRRSLPEVESAGYYMISRFADIILNLGISCSTILFPLVSERHEKGQHGQQTLLAQSFWVTLALGFAFTFAVAPVSHLLFTLKADWNAYSAFTPHLIALSLNQAVRGSVNCFVVYQIARNQFRFVLFWAAVYGLEIVTLYCLTGYAFFTPWLPLTWLAALESFNPCRLTVVLGIMLLYTLPSLFYALVAMRKISKGQH